jgi:uncharacterized damage-inducible protein DinB
MAKSHLVNAEYYNKYIAMVAEDDILAGFAAQQTVLEHFLQNIPQDKAGYAYAPGKWTIQQALQHMIDTERIFAYRALCFARRDETPLPGFDENTYADAAPSSHRSLQHQIDEFLTVRKASLLLFESFLPEDLQQIGKANTYDASVSSLGYIILGHVYHHIRVIEERYYAG